MKSQRIYRHAKNTFRGSHYFKPPVQQRS